MSFFATIPKIRTTLFHLKKINKLFHLKKINKVSIASCCVQKQKNKNEQCPTLNAFAMSGVDIFPKQRSNVLQ